MKLPTLHSLRYRLNVAGSRTAFALDAIGSCLRLALARNAPPEAITGIITGRNDDYMSDFALRLRATVTWNLRYLLTEVIFVEWNTAPDRPLLSPMLAAELPGLRAYVVTPSVHADLGGTDRVPMLEFHAKNLGIRRAETPWILATNADALIGHSTALRLRSGPLEPAVAWTAQRFDINWKEGRRRPTSLLDVLSYRRVIPDHELGTGEFLLASRERWMDARGYDQASTAHRIGIDKRGTAQLRAHGATLRSAGRILHLAHPTSCTEGVRPHHGEMATLDGIPYVNPPDWGLPEAREVPIADRVWRIEI